VGLPPVQALAQAAPAPRVERPAPLLVLGGAAGAAVGIVSFGLIGALVGGNSCGHGRHDLRGRLNGGGFDDVDLDLRRTPASSRF
jgi:hypothetical protein